MTHGDITLRRDEERHHRIKWGSGKWWRRRNLIEEIQRFFEESFNGIKSIVDDGVTLPLR